MRKVNVGKILDLESDSATRSELWMENDTEFAGKSGTSPISDHPSAR